MRATGKPFASIFNKATSVRLSAPTTRALNRRPSSSRTWASSMSATTCALVRTSPSLARITPEARSRIWLSRTLAGSGQARRSAKSFSGANSSSMSPVSRRDRHAGCDVDHRARRLATSDEKAGACSARTSNSAPAAGVRAGPAAHARRASASPAEVKVAAMRITAAWLSRRPARRAAAEPERNWCAPPDRRRCPAPGD